MITINVDKAKTVAHDMRRQARAEEFKPFDEAIAKQIPGQAEGAEAQRQLIRDKYVVVQAQIDSASDVATLKTIVEGL
jgi:hypothetical protein